MVITKEVLDQFLEEQKANPVDLNSFFEEASPFVRVAIKNIANLFLEEPGVANLVVAFLTLFLLCYRQRNKSIKEWVESDFVNRPTEEEEEIVKANTPWIEEGAAEAYPILLAGGSATSILAEAFYIIHTCIQMQKEITE